MTLTHLVTLPEFASSSWRESSMPEPTAIVCRGADVSIGCRVFVHTDWYPGGPVVIGAIYGRRDHASLRLVLVCDRA